MLAIVQDIIFPIMRYTEADEELWDADPIEYIRTKFGEREFNNDIFNGIEITEYSFIRYLWWLCNTSSSRPGPLPL